MADRVMKAEHIGNITHEVRADRIVLKVDGMHGKKAVRAELSLDYIDVGTVVDQLRTGVEKHLANWTRARETLGPRNG